MRQGLLAFVSVFALVGAASGQTYSNVENEALGIRFKLHDKLQSIPLKLGEAHPNMKMRFEPRSAGDYIHGRLGTYEWYLYVLAFPKESPTATGKPAADKTPATGGDGEGEGEGDGAKPGRAELLEAANRERTARDWNIWVTEKDPGIKDRTFKTKGKEMKAKGKAPVGSWWEYSDKMGSHSGQDIYWYSCAGVYELPTSQIAIVVTVPVMDKSGEKPEDKHYRWQTTMAQSLEVLRESGGGDDDVSSVDAKKDLYATTEERKKALDAAKANIASLPGWDYFTMPNYIVLYSWNPDKPDRRPGSVKFAQQLVEALEKMRDLYIQDYPPHDKMVQPYSVLRVCDDHEAFMKYGGSPYGVIGWFSPLSKELVVFFDRQRIYNMKGMDVMATAMHEGWHQYANSYFGEDVELHRWFDEGTGDYYGGFTNKRSGWSYTPDKGRVRSIEAQIARKTFIPTREIISWNKDKFYGPRAPDHYAQGYTLVDFLRRGADKLGKKFDPRWGTILETYRVTLLETKNQKTAVEKAFEGVDFAVFEEAWLEWIKKHMK